MEPNSAAPDSSNNGSIPQDNINNNPSLPAEPLITPTPIVITPNARASAVEQPVPNQNPVPVSPNVTSNLNDSVSAPHLIINDQINSTSPPAPNTSSSPTANIPWPVTNASVASSPPNDKPILGVPVTHLPEQPNIIGGQVPPMSAVGGKFSRKTLLTGSALVVTIVALSMGYVFGLYLPNKPANVYQTGLDRSGQNLTKLVDKFTQKDQLAKLENSEIIANAEAHSTGTVDGSFSGTFDVKLAKTKSDGSLDIHLKSGDQAEKSLNVKFLTELPDNKKFPNLYFQINGLKAIGMDVFLPSMSAYEGKWIAVESDYLESISSGQGAPKNKENITSAEVASLIRTISNTSNKYMLTSDNNRAVLENKSFVGKETTDGINTYHYKVGINKNHAKDYCKALSTQILSEAIYKKLLNVDDAGIADQKKNIDKDCEDAVNSIKDDTTLDMWIDAKYKLIHKLRIYDEKDRGIYTDIGQTYTGGDKINLFVTYHHEAHQSDAKFTVDVDTKAYTSKGTITWNQKGKDAYGIRITFEAKPYAGEVKVEKPAGVISIKDVLSKFGLNPSSNNTTSTSTSSSSSSSVQSKAKDTERQTDIKALHSQLEAYYAMKGYYPTQGDLNSPTWRSQNMRGLDNEALRDPDGTATTLATTATTKQYAYVPNGCTKVDNACQTYTLTALLSTGASYTKRSLN